MIKHVWTVLCLKSIIDRDNNNISLVEILEKLNLTVELPVTIPIQFEIVTLWSREALDASVKGYYKVEISSPSKSDVMEIANGDVDLTKFARTRNRIRHRGLVLKEYGIYTVDVYYRSSPKDGWSCVAAVPVEIAAVSK